MSRSFRNARDGEAAGRTSAELCSVRVGDTMFGLPINHILEIVASALSQRVPLAEGFIGGLVHYRGDVFTTVSLRHLLGMPKLDRPQPILVFESPTGCFGLVVDAVGEILAVQSKDYEPNPSTLDDRRKSLFMGTYKLNDGLLVALDPSRLDPMYLSGSRPSEPETPCVH
jgi:purine-binding chemotaxis protein CheW